MALVYPNNYKVGMSSLGFQLVYSLLNAEESVLCERFFLSSQQEPLRSLESQRPLNHFPLIFFSVSFEHDYVNLVRLLLEAGIEPLAEHRKQHVNGQQPLVICGGVASFMNPEPLAPFVDLFFIGEAEPLLSEVLTQLVRDIDIKDRKEVLFDLVREKEGLYAPSFYSPLYDQDGRFQGNSVEPDVPEKVKKIIVTHCSTAAHSEILTPEAEFADLYLTELGRGCSRGCRFCAAGFIYRPPRLWDGDAVVKGLKKRFPGVERVGLLGMEMADQEGLAAISRYLTESGCSLSFSSLRADRISGPLLELLAASNLKSVAIAPDGASERLRKVVNKGLTENDLLSASEELVSAGIYKLKIYVMIGLPTETYGDLQELLELVKKVKNRISGIGRKRGRLTEIIVSLNTFTPKPWTPFQYHPFGRSERLETGKKYIAKEAVLSLKKKIGFLRKNLLNEANVRLLVDKPEKVLFQAVLSRGDRRLALVLLDMAERGYSWKQAMKNHNLKPEQFVMGCYDGTTVFPWHVLDHGIEPNYLWQEYMKAFEEKLTVSCDTQICRRCGVCREK